MESISWLKHLDARIAQRRSEMNLRKARARSRSKGAEAGTCGVRLSSIPARSHQAVTRTHSNSLLALALVSLASCGGESPTDTIGFGVTPVATTVSVSPTSMRVFLIGGAGQLVATVLDQGGAVMGGASVTWTSSESSVATVSPAGLVTAVAEGTATVTATAGSATRAVSVVVNQTIDFGSYPDGSLACDSTCPLASEFSSLGVVFRGESTCTSVPITWKVINTSIYDVAGAPVNHSGVTGCGAGRWFVTLPTDPVVVQFEVTVNDQKPVLLSALDGADQTIPASFIARSLRTYTSRNGVLFRVETIQIESPAGVSELWFDTSFYGVFLDNLRIN
jgi:hypothetical protein